MSKFGSKEEIIKSIETHFEHMQQGKMSMDDLELLVEQARELYERVLILRYKAYEEKVFGEVKEVLQASTVEDGLSFEHQVEVKEELHDFNTTALVEKEDEVAQEEEKSGEPVFDFSLFEEPNNEAQELQQEELQQESTFKAEEAAFEEPTIIEEDEFHEEISFDSGSEPVMEEPAESANWPEPDVDIFATILQKSDHVAGAHLMSDRLQTLLGAFGFNEKYQYIQELFRGSGDDFNQAIDVLDNLNSFDEAKKQLYFYVKLHSWDLDSEITAEFVKKIERRYRA